MPIRNPRNRTIDRYAIYMDIQNGKKDRNAPPGCWSKPKLGWWDAWRDRYDAPIRGSQNGTGPHGRYTRRVAEEIEAKQPTSEANERQPTAHEKADHHNRQATENERSPGRMRWGKDSS